MIGDLLSQLPRVGKRKRYQRTKPMMLKSIPVDLKAHFKAWCAKRGVTMQNQIVFLMKQTIKDEVITRSPINKRKGNRYDTTI